MRRKTDGDGAMHATKALLIETTVGLLDTVPVEQLTADAVLDASGVSRGSLYHHFEDYPDLLEHARVARFARYVDESIEQIGAMFEVVRSGRDMAAAVTELNQAMQGSDRASRRFERTVTIALAAGNPRFRARLGQEQERLTEALTGLIETGQAAGWIVADVDARAAAVLIQAYTLGRIVDDITPQHMEPGAWGSLISRILAPLLST